MGNVQAGPTLDFSHPLLGNTVTLNNTKTSETGTIVQYNDPNETTNTTKEDKDKSQQNFDPKQVTIAIQMAGADATTLHTTTLDQVTLAAKARTPYCCTQEEACAGWIWERLPSLIDERVDADTTTERTDPANDKRLMKEMAKTESVMLGFLTVETKSKKEHAAWDQLNLATVASNIVASLFWRLNLSSQTVLDTPRNPELGLKIPGGLFGTGLNGRPVLWTLPCWFQWSDITGDEIESVELRNQEQMNLVLDSLDAASKKYRDMIVIVNLDGMGAWVVKYLSKFKRHATVSETHYPGRAWKTLCINSSGVISRGYSTFVRPFLSTHTQNLVVMCAKGQETTDALRKYIAPEFIPRCFGGDAKGNGDDDILLESQLFQDGVNVTAAAFRDEFLEQQKKKGSK
jgi:hypothetical protein